MYVINRQNIILKYGIRGHFRYKAAVSTWGHEVYGIGIVGPFTQDNENKMFIPDPATKKGKGRRQTSWKDELEARFALVDRVDEAGPINPHPRAAGPSKT